MTSFSKSYNLIFRLLNLTQKKPGVRKSKSELEADQRGSLEKVKRSKESPKVHFDLF